MPKAQASDGSIDDARDELEQLELERDEASAVAEVTAKRCKRLAEQIGRLNLTAIEEVKQEKELQARKTLEEKHQLQRKYDRLQAKAETNYALAAKLDKVIGKKQTKLIVLMGQKGQLQPTTSQDQAVASYSQDEPAIGETFQYADSSGGIQEDKDLENRFLELERQTLERMLQVTQQKALVENREREMGKVEEEVETEGCPSWWTDGYERLQKGIFGVASLDDREQQAELLLKQLVNSRVMGTEPDLPRMMVLVRLCSRYLNIYDTGTEGRNVVICSVEGSRSLESYIRTSLFQSAVRQCIQYLSDKESMEGIEPQKGAPALLVGIACVLGLDWKAASNICAAQVCQWMGQMMLDIGTEIRRSPTESLLASDNSSVHKLARVLESISPALKNEHVRNVRDKVGGLLSYSELQAVNQMVSKVTQSEKVRAVIRLSLGLS